MSSVVKDYPIDGHRDSFQLLTGGEEQLGGGDGSEATGPSPLALEWDQLVRRDPSTARCAPGRYRSPGVLELWIVGTKRTRKRVERKTAEISPSFAKLTTRPGFWWRVPMPTLAVQRENDN